MRRSKCAAWRTGSRFRTRLVESGVASTNSKSVALARDRLELSPHPRYGRMETLSTSFVYSTLNETTFLIVEDDKLGEYPFIYVKVYVSVLVFIDTGCGGAFRDGSANVTCLRVFLETYPIVDNDNQALNPGSEKNYVVISPIVTLTT